MDYEFINTPSHCGNTYLLIKKSLDCEIIDYICQDGIIFSWITTRKIDVRVGEEISKPLSIPLTVAPEKLSFAPPPLFRLSLDVMKNDENLRCVGNDDFFVVGSHYSKIPIPNDPTFYKYIDKTSKYNKIDFDKLKTNVKCTNILYEDSIVRILGISDLKYLYKNSRREKDNIKISILEYICKKLGI